LAPVALREVKLAGCGLGPEAVGIVCATLAEVGVVETVDLSRNGRFLEGARHVAGLVARTPSLRRLYLEKCRLQWAPEMVRAQAKMKGKGKNQAGAAAGGKKGEKKKQKKVAIAAADPATEFDPSALFTLADIAKRLRQLEECRLSDEDYDSEPGSMIRQSLAINRSLAYERHTDLVRVAVPPFPDRKEDQAAHRTYALTLDIDSRFLMKERLLHQSSVGVSLDHNEPKAPETDTPDDGTPQRDKGASGGAAKTKAEPKAARRGIGKLVGRGKEKARNPGLAPPLNLSQFTGGTDAFFLH